MINEKERYSDIFREFVSQENMSFEYHRQLRPTGIDFTPLKLKSIGSLYSFSGKIQTQPILAYENFTEFVHNLVDTLGKNLYMRKIEYIAKYITLKFTIVNLLDKYKSENKTKSLLIDSMMESVASLEDIILAAADGDARFQSRFVKTMMAVSQSSSYDDSLFSDIPYNMGYLQKACTSILDNVDMDKVYAYPFQDILLLIEAYANSTNIVKYYNGREFMSGGLGGYSTLMPRLMYMCAYLSRGLLRTPVFEEFNQGNSSEFHVSMITLAFRAFLNVYVRECTNTFEPEAFIDLQMSALTRLLSTPELIEIITMTASDMQDIDKIIRGM